MLFNRAIRALWLLVVPFSPVAKGQQQPELDITKVGLRPRSEVIKVLGPPSSCGGRSRWLCVGVCRIHERKTGPDRLSIQGAGHQCGTSFGEGGADANVDSTSRSLVLLLELVHRAAGLLWFRDGQRCDPSDFSGISVGFKQLAGASNLMSPTKVHKERSAGVD